MTEPAAQAHSPSRSRRRFVLWAALLVLMAAVIGGYFLVRSSVGPVAEASGSSGPRPSAGTEYLLVTSLSPGDDQVYAVDANDPGSFAVAFEIQNRGRFAVTLEGVPQEPALVVQETAAVSSVALPGNDFRAGSDVPLDGVVMEPGERRRLVAKFSWEDLCEPEEQSEEELTGITWTYGVTLRYRAIGGLVQREEEIEPPTGVAFICGALPRPDGVYVTRGSAPSGE